MRGAKVNSIPEACFLLLRRMRCYVRLSTSFTDEAECEFNIGCIESFNALYVKASLSETGPILTDTCNMLLCSMY